ncbi:hypothetical protein OGZ01_30640 (plasmid) [Vibrio harveyi]|nr:hypothetical protein [Vibrio harveyi]
MSKKRTVYNALPIVAAAYGEKFGVKVALGSDTASTDGQTISLFQMFQMTIQIWMLFGATWHMKLHTFGLRTSM